MLRLIAAYLSETTISKSEIKKRAKQAEKEKKAAEKAAKQEIKTSKAMHAAEDKLKGAAASREKAEQKLTVRGFSVSHL